MAEAPVQDSTPDTAPRKKRVYTQLWFWVLVGITLGIAVGLLAPGLARELKILADLFIQLIKVVIGPVIFCTVVVGIASLGNLARAGGLALQALGYFLVATCRAVARPAGGQPRAARRRVRGAADAGAGRPGHRSRSRPVRRAPASRRSSRTSCSRRASWRPSWRTRSCRCSCWPSSPPARSACWSPRMREKAVAAIDGIAKVIFGIIKIIMWAAPLAAFGGMAYTVAVFGASSLTNLGPADADVLGHLRVVRRRRAGRGGGVGRVQRLQGDPTDQGRAADHRGHVVVRDGAAPPAHQAGVGRRVAPDRRPRDPDRLLVQPRRHLHLPDARCAVHPAGRRQRRSASARRSASRR